MNKQQKLKRLGGVLDAYGADARRWPEAERDSLQSLIDTDDRARSLYREAQALARVMDAAPSMNASESLKAGILAAAANDHTRNATVVPIAAAVRRGETDMESPPVSRLWPAAALAASFALGVYLGISGVGGTAVDSALRLASLGNGNGAVEGVYSDAWLDGNGGGDAEDLL